LLPKIEIDALLLSFLRALLQDYEKISVIGSGAFSNVISALSLRNNVKVAIKMVPPFLSLFPSPCPGIFPASCILNGPLEQPVSTTPPLL